MSGATPVLFRVTYARPSELRDDVTRQMVRGGLLVKVHDAADLTLDSPVQLELVVPDGTSLHAAVRVLQVLPGFGVAVSVDPELVDRSRCAADGPDAPGSGPARHERLGPPGPPGPPGRSRPVTQAPVPGGSSPAIPMQPTPGSCPASPLSLQPSSRPPTAPAAAQSPPGAPPRTDGPTRLDKVQLALHGNRDERHAILRDRDRTLHSFVLKNPRIDADDVLAIAKNAQMTADLLGLIGERKDWVQRPAVALALARNPKTPPELAVRALDHVSTEALRQLAKGAGALPHVTQAARKKLLG